MSRAIRPATIGSFVALLAPALAAQTTTLVSVDSFGMQANSECAWASLSANGRFVAFYSDATNLVPDGNWSSDIFVRDLQLNLTTRASVDSSGAEVHGSSGAPSISADGRYVAFYSYAALVAGDTNHDQDIFVHDMQSGATTRASVDSSGVQAQAACGEPALSDNGRFVAFTSTATNLVPGDTNGRSDIFVHDLQTGATERVSVSSLGVQSNGESTVPSISADGRYVSFMSLATSLVAGDTNNQPDIFVRDRSAGTTWRVSVSSSGVQANAASQNAALSADGRYVAFDSGASNLVPNDTNAMHDVFVHELQTGATTRVDVDSAGLQTSGYSYSYGPRLSGNGRFVAFVSDAGNLVPGDTNHRNDVFVHDNLFGATARVSVSSAGGQGNADCSTPAISANGRSIAFVSRSTNLILVDGNIAADVYLRDTTIAPTSYCTSATTTNGCTPAISSNGTPSANATSGFTVRVTSVEGQRSGLVFYGISGPLALPWAAGSTSFLCVKPPTQRTPPHNSGGTLFACDGSLAVDLLAFWAANPGAVGQPIYAGLKIHAQGWMRDPVAPKSTNLSNALEFDLVP